MPGFDFLKALAAQTGKGIEGLQGLGQLGGLSGLSGFQQWVAPTLDPEELEKRIDELRTVQFWLEQNARLLGATIQALEVQKMTLNTLRSMNVQAPDLQQVLGALTPKTRQGRAPGKAGAASGPSPSGQTAAPAPDAAAALVDPMKWWGALTEQFQTLASQALAATPGRATADAASTGKASPAAPAKAGARRRASAKAPKKS